MIRSRWRISYPIVSAWVHSSPIWAQCSLPCSLGSRRLRGLVAPSSSHPLGMATLSFVLHYSNSTRLGLSHRQTPQTRLAPPKLPQPLVQLVDVPFLPARLVGGICTAVWELPALYVTELVCQDGRCRVASEKQGHQGLAPPIIGDGARVEYRRGQGLVKFWHPQSFY